jgi:hypothetical protein
VTFERKQCSVNLQLSWRERHGASMERLRLETMRPYSRKVEDLFHSRMPSGLPFKNAFRAIVDRTHYFNEHSPNLMEPYALWRVYRRPDSDPKGLK